MSPASSMAVVDGGVFIRESRAVLAHGKARPRIEHPYDPSVGHGVGMAAQGLKAGPAADPLLHPAPKTSSVTSSMTRKCGVTYACLLADWSLLSMNSDPSLIRFAEHIRPCLANQTQIIASRRFVPRLKLGERRAISAQRAQLTGRAGRLRGPLAGRHISRERSPGFPKRRRLQTVADM